MFTESLAKFREGLEELLFLNPTLGSMARAMGTPVWDSQQNTAYVTYDSNNKSIMFAFNPDFILQIPTEQVAAVIAHESYHVLLKHLDEFRMDHVYPNKDALQKAQECIINDTVENVHLLKLPDFVMRGKNIVGCDCSPYDTKTVYDMLNSEVDNTDSRSNNSQDRRKPPSDGVSSGSGSDTGSGESGGSESNSDGSDNTNGTGDESQGADNTGKNDKDSDVNGKDANTDEDGSAETDVDSPSNTGSKEKEDNKSDSDNAPVEYEPCGGFQMNNASMDEIANAFGRIISDAAHENGQTIDDFLEDAYAGGGFSISGAAGYTDAVISDARMNWKMLLAEINPKVLEAGKKNRKIRNNWARYDRRLAGSYPDVIIPKVDHLKPKNNDKGDTLPVFIIALDLSGSIPRTLVKTLQGFLDDIPEKLIKAYACTWSSSLVPYDESKKVVYSGGTNIQKVVDYVNKIKMETKTDPYVLVITDGQYSHNHRKPGKKWFYMGVTQRDVPYIKRTHNVGDDVVYYVGDFRE